MDNPYLDDFYKDMRAWAFHSQVYFLTHKFRLHLDLNDQDGTMVMDRTIYEDAEIFATNLARGRFMKKRDFQTYMELYETMKRGVAATGPVDLSALRCALGSPTHQAAG